MAQAGESLVSSSSGPTNRHSISSASPSSSSSLNRASSAAASSSSSPVREEEESHDANQHQFGESETDQQHFGFSRGNMFFFDDASAIRDDTWSCVIVVLTFWFFVSMTLILGVYGAVSVTLGPNSSVLIQPNPLFVQSIKVEEVDSNPGLVLYGFYGTPSLNVVKSWSKFLNASVPADSHKEWTYFLNEGSEINISFSVRSPSSSLFLVIAQGSEGLSQWLEDPTYPNITLSWNVIRGSGSIQQKIWKSSSYYVAVGNLNTEEVEVQLNLIINAFLYNTNEAYYKCTFTNGMCGLNILFPKGNSVVLSSPGPEEESTSDEWYVKVSYGPRWATYIVGIATMTMIMLVAFNYLNKFQCMRNEGVGVRYGEGEPERAPLLSYKDDDLSSWGSSYDSVSNDEEDLEDFLGSNSLEGKSSRDCENGNNTRRLCAICFDAPRDCFFLPCGHCVACFACGTRIVEVAGTCPVCRRNMKKVRKIFTV